MVLPLLLSVGVCLGIWLRLRWVKVRSFWARRGVPHYPPHPVLGSLTFLQKENPAVWMRQVYNEFKSPYVGMWLFWRPALVVNCPELARKVLVKDHDLFRDRFARSGKTDPAGAHTLFLVKDPLWTSIRRRLTAVFTAAKLRNLQTITQDKANDLVLRIRVDIKNKDLINLRTVCTDFTTDVIGESAFGVSCETVKTGDSVMRRITKEFMKFNLYRGLSWSSIFFLPEMVDIFRFSLFPKHTIEDLRQIFHSIIEQRGGYKKQIKDSKDLLDALIKIKQEAATENEEMGEDLLVAQAAIFLLGGFDTSGAALTWAIYELAWHPHHQERLYKELLKSQQQNDNKPFDTTLLAQQTHLNCVIKETLRKYPPMGWLDRVASKDYQIDEHLTVPAGTAVYVNAVGMHMDPEYFPEPQKFNPERFLPENEKKIVPYTFMPFGEGPRNCIGKRFAYQTLRYALASIFLNYEVRSIPGSLAPDQCPVEKNGMFLMPVSKMSVEFLPRAVNQVEPYSRGAGLKVQVGLSDKSQNCRRNHDKSR